MKPITPAEVLDSRDIINRIAEIEGLVEDEALLPLLNEYEELKALRQLNEDCEGYGDWEYGEQLTRDDYFLENTKELVKDCYGEIDGLVSGTGKWPYTHLVMDWEAAAEELKLDYVEVEFMGFTYWMRA